MKMILHIGFPKTGSSSLQAFLCRNTTLVGINATYRYYVAKKHGVLAAPLLWIGARAQPWKHLSTMLGPREAISAVIRYLNETPDTQTIPILSHESWVNKSADLASLPKSIADLLDLEIVAYVRPQISWLQSAWWQWFAWADPLCSLEQLWPGYKPNIAWSAALERFDELPFVSKVTARLCDQSGDIVSDFMDYLEVENAPAAYRVNMSVSQTHIALYRRFQWLRRHNDGRIDAVLKSILPSGDPAPWCVSRQLAQTVVDDMRDDNLKLAARFGPATREKMLADQRWWDASAYSAHWTDT